jgi:PIN domain nuclease of toxin-antitoxin system
MKVLLDSGVWWKLSMRVPLKKPLADFLAYDVTEWWLSPFATTEMLYKVNHKRLTAPADAGWLEEALRGYRIAPFSLAAGIQAGSWKWAHGDPVDRCLAAIALSEGLTLIHTDTVLKKLPGFPQLYFPA